VPVQVLWGGIIRHFSVAGCRFCFRRAGDDRAFEDLVRTYGSRLLAVARRFVRNDEDAEALLRMCSRALRKVRRKLGRFTLDHFRERDLWLAEIELGDERESFERPAWLAEEVTQDPEYTNARLATPRRAG